MDVPIYNRETGEVQFTADVDCDEAHDDAYKRGLAVQWAIENDEPLMGANLNGAYLVQADLHGVNLLGATLYRADLTLANLEDANLSDCNFTEAKLDHALLNKANCSGAVFDGASMHRVGVSMTYLWRASMEGADLYGMHGDNHYVKCVQLVYDQPLVYTSEILQIGCISHPIADWNTLPDEAFAKMGDPNALSLWKNNKDFIFQMIEEYPAREM